MKPHNGSIDRESSQDSQPTESEPKVGQFFLPEWVVGVLYSGRWHDVKEGTFREGISTDHGDLAVYEDPFDGNVVFVLDSIIGYRVKKPPPLPPPVESNPKASITKLFPKNG